MINQHSRNRIVAVAALALISACASANAKHPLHDANAKAAAARPAASEAAKPVGEAVAYEALEHHVGAEILIETTFNTVRRGTLLKYTNPALTLQLGPEHGSVELTVPRETVRGARVLAPAASNQAAPDAKQDQGNRSAEKN